MRYILILLLFISGAASAQFAPTSAKTKFSNGIAIGSKDTSAFSAADTMVLTIARDSVMYYKYRGVWRPIATGGNLNNYKLISDTLFNNGYTTRGRTKQYGDSIAALKLNISDTAAMLANRLKISDTLTMLSKLSLDRVLINGNTSGRGVVLGTGSFTSSGSSNTVEIAHSSGSGIALNITKGGNGEGLYVNKTSGSGNAATIIGTLNATTLVKSGGTSSQFLMADGSVNTSVLPSGAYLPLSGGDLVGILTMRRSALSTLDFLAKPSFAIDFNTNYWNSATGNQEIYAGSIYGIANASNVNPAPSTRVVIKAGSTDVASFSSTGATTLSGALNGTSAAFSGAGSFLGDFSVGTTSTDPFARSNGRTLVVGSGVNTAIAINAAAGSGRGALIDFGTDGTRTAELISNTNETTLGTLTSTPLNFSINGTNAGRISTNRNWLIKTTTDNGTDALQVAGSGRFVGTNSSDANNVTTGYTADLYALAVRQKGASAGISGTQFMAQVISAAGAEGLEIYTPNAKPLILGTNATENLRLSSGGAATFSSTVSANTNTTIGNANPIYNGNSGTAASLLSSTSSWLELATNSTSDGNGGIVSINNTNIAGADKRVVAFGGVTDGANNSGAFFVATWNAGSAAERFRIAPSGAATFSSTVSATGFIVSSDRRLKNIVSRSGDMVTYTLKADKNKILHYGYIAQEVEKVLPTTVSTDDKGMKAVNYIEVLVKKVNDLEKEIAELKKHNK